MTCRMCDKVEPRGCGYTCCKVDNHVIMNFDKECIIELDTMADSKNSRNPVETGKAD